MRQPRPGNVPAIAQQRGGDWRFALTDMEISGPKFDRHPERAFGPILWTQPSLWEGTLVMTAQYGIEAHDDAAWWIATPAIANIWPRRWFPREPGENRRADDAAYTGRFLDGFSNWVTADGTGFRLGSRGTKTTNRTQSLLGLAYLSGALGLSPLTADPAGSSDLVPIFGPERFTL